VNIAKKSHFVIRAGDVIYNKLFAWKGSFGIVPSELDGMFVSDKSPTCEADLEQVNLDYLRWCFRWSPLWDQARGLSTGSAAISKLTLNPPKFLEPAVPLPPLAELWRIVARIEELAGKIAEANGVEHAASDEGEQLYPAFRDNLFRTPACAYYGASGIIDYVDDFRRVMRNIWVCRFSFVSR
jgi:type I restriction enzyme S subunit